MLQNDVSSQLRVERFCFPVTFLCNLRCKLCAERAPYYKNPYYPTLPELKGQADTIFDAADHIERFDLTGGEPLLRNDLYQFVDYLFCQYSSRIGLLRITTNGTLLPDAALLKSLQKWGPRIRMIVDSYLVSQKVQEIAVSLASAGIPFEVRDYTVDLHCNGWVDYGDFNQKHDRAEAKRLFDTCMVPQLDFFLCMVGGLLFPCARARLLYERGITKDFLDLSAVSGPRESRKKALHEFLNIKALDSCAYCNGLCENSERFMPAEQIEGIPQKV